MYQQGIRGAADQEGVYGMQLHQFRTDGFIDVTEVNLSDVRGAKRTALALVAHPARSGVYRIKFVDAEYDRTCWDTYNLDAELPVGALAYAGASS